MRQFAQLSIHKRQFSLKQDSKVQLDITSIQKTQFMGSVIDLSLYVTYIVGEKELKKRSQAVQRELPRPYDVNMSVLRPMGANDPQLNELQKVRRFLY